MLNLEYAKEYLENSGIILPEFVLNALVEQANSIQECLDANYTPATALVIQLSLIGLMGLALCGRYIRAQTASSGASRVFRYHAFADRWQGLSRLLLGLDKQGCATHLLPLEPNNLDFCKESKI